jgi:hypothetical protein
LGNTKKKDSIRIEPRSPSAKHLKGKQVVKPDILARLRSDFGDYVIPDVVMDEVLRYARSSYIERQFEATDEIDWLP